MFISITLNDPQTFDWDASARIFLETEDVRQVCDVLFDKRCSVVPFTVSSTSTATSSKLSTVEYLAIE